jgi:Uma2 family endonuclease
MVTRPTPSPTITAPPLESGDRLTRVEFERRYSLVSHSRKAELVEGVVYVASPVRAKQHGRPHAIVMAWLGAYWMATPGVDVQDNATVRLDDDNEPQPDALLRIEPEVGGASAIDADDYLTGAPELIVEIAASSAAYDLNAKLNVYRRHGVQEYIVWQMYENRLDWFFLQAGQYGAVPPDDRGILRSQVFPGLWLSVPALLAGDRAMLLNILQEGIQTPQHQAFVEQLQASPYVSN